MYTQKNFTATRLQQDVLQDVDRSPIEIRRLVININIRLHVIASHLFVSLYRYKEQNLQCTSSYRAYDERVPKCLHNRPRYVVEHIMRKIESGVLASAIEQINPKLFMVQGAGQRYQVWLGTDKQLPSCQCVDFRMTRLPCKHICAVVQQPNVGWESIGSRFNTHPLFTLDACVVQVSSSAKLPPPPTAAVHDKSGRTEQGMCGKDEDAQESDQPITSGLPHRRKGNIRKECIQSLKSLQDELYILTDKTVLANTLAMLNGVIAYARKNRPKENGMTLKDKSVSLRKPPPGKTARRKMKAKVLCLVKRKRKMAAAKRFGAAADARRQAVRISSDSEADKGSPAKKQRKQRTRVDPTRDWVTIRNIKLTHRLKDILQDKSGWLTDEHIDAAQYLVGELNPGVGGLNSVITMTHRSQFALPHDQNHTIQCHNIGGHWVTSSSTTGKVIVFDSLGTGLNASLKNQLVNLYRVLCNEDGSLNVTVVCQQRQKGASDCGLYAIANAVALGLDPCAVSWVQDDMRQHLISCFEKRELEMFPHVPNSVPSRCTNSHYVISIHCVCFRHIPGAEMVNCNSCNNWYHHMPPHNCITLSPKQIAAIVTNSPFLCAYCELPRPGMS